MLKMMTAKWWVLLLRGIVAILLGLIIFLRPGVPLATVLILFAAYVVIDGVFTIFSAFSHRKDTGHWWGQAFKGLTGIIIGFLIFAMPELAEPFMSKLKTPYKGFEHIRYNNILLVPPNMPTYSNGGNAWKMTRANKIAK